MTVKLAIAIPNKFSLILHAIDSVKSIAYIIVKPKQAGTCGRSIRNDYTSKSLICTNIRYYRTDSIYLLSRLYAILLSITRKTARKWKFGIVLRPQLPACFGFTIDCSNIGKIFDRRYIQYF